ncbi:MAG: hypothetical protein KGJ32_10810 [Xanthomonadaceae bacterium]|nr:hypothetical protein [Xanthomonadaceae bacterium]
MSRLPIAMFALLTGLVIGANAIAQNPPASAAHASRKNDERQLIKPGDRNCLQQTGSLIRARKGRCLPLPGQSYSGDELQRTGATDTAHALQMLDPRISIGH